MDEFELFGTVLRSEDDAIAFLQKHGIFETTKLPCTNERPGWKCSATMRLGTKEGQKAFVCPYYKCRTSRTIRSTNLFLSHFDKNRKSRNNLSLVRIIHFVYKWLYDQDSIEKREVKTGLWDNTIMKWNQLCRDVCTQVLQHRPKYARTSSAPVQIDEAYFSGRRKYNRGRLRKGDVKKKGEKQAQIEMGVSKPSKVEKLRNKRNYGNRVIGPWVFGVYWSKNCVRFFVVPDRKGTTLIPIIKAYVLAGSVVVSDEWKGYSRLEESGFVHETMCHKTNFVNPTTGYHTQAIERAWIEGKAVIKRTRYPTINLQSYLDEVSWRMLRRGHPDGLFSAFMRDIRDCYNQL